MEIEPHYETSDCRNWQLLNIFYMAGIVINISLCYTVLKLTGTLLGNIFFPSFTLEQTRRIIMPVYKIAKCSPADEVESGFPQGGNWYLSSSLRSFLSRSPFDV